MVGWGWDGWYAGLAGEMKIVVCGMTSRIICPETSPSPVLGCFLGRLKIPSQAKKRQE